MCALMRNNCVLLLARFTGGVPLLLVIIACWSTSDAFIEYFCILNVFIQGVVFLLTFDLISLFSSDGYVYENILLIYRFNLHVQRLCLNQSGLFYLKS